MKIEKIILTGVILIIIVAGIFLSSHYCKGLNFVNEGIYYKLAGNIVSYRMFTLNGTDPTAVKLPGYPFMLSVLVFLGAGLYVLKLSNFIAVAFSAVLVYKISYKLAGKNAAVISSLLVLFYPRFISYAAYLHPEAYSSAVFLLLILTLFDAGSISVGKSAILGGGLGFAALTTPGFMASLPVFLFRIIKENGEKCAGKLIMFLLFFTIVFGGWIARNYVYFKSVCPAESAGIRLLQGNSVKATGDKFPADISEYRRNTYGMTPMKKSAYYRNAALEYICKNKVRCLKLFLGKFINYFAFTEGYNVENNGQFIRKIIIHISWGVLLAFFLLRLVLLWKYKLMDYEGVLISLYFLNAVFYSVFSVKIRYRLPFDYLLVIVVGVFLSRVIGERVIAAGGKVQYK